MQANEDMQWLRSELPDFSQLPYREDFRHDQNEKRRPCICIRPELSAGEGLIQCDMTMDPPREDRVCLSYMWGSEEDQKSILIDSRPFSVRDNLWNFLDRARLTGITRPIWIDAICIDQTNVHMRNHWVQQMGRIFKEAAEVLVWLGDGEPGIEVALDVMEDIGRSWSRRSMHMYIAEDAEEEFHECMSEVHCNPGSLHEAIMKLINLPYWNRLWIKQEVLLNRNVCFMYGKAVNHHLRDLF